MELSSNKIEVRLALLPEASTVAALLQAAFSGYKGHYTEAAYAATTPTLHELEQRWPEGPVWLAIQAGRAVGTVAALPAPPFLHLRSMAVLPEARGQGIGRRLLGQAQEYALAHHYAGLHLHT